QGVPVSHEGQAVRRRAPGDRDAEGRSCQSRHPEGDDELMATMRAVMKKEAGLGTSMQQVEVPKCGPDDVLLRVRAASICGTDLHIYKWDSWAQSVIKPPLILGHEIAGEVVEVG